MTIPGCPGIFSVTFIIYFVGQIAFWLESLCNKYVNIAPQHQEYIKLHTQYIAIQALEI